MALPDQILTRQGLNTNGDNVRESFMDVIYNISPTERPYHQNVGRDVASSTFHEWSRDSLAPPRADNAHVDGDDFSAEGSTGQVGSGFDGVAISGGNRLGNECVISRKDIVISRRSDIVNKAGRKSELNYQLAKAGQELQRDCEAAALNNQAAVTGSNTVAGRTAGVPAWLRTNTNRGALGADPTLSGGASGSPNTAATDGTDRALSESALLGVIGEIYVGGGDPDMIMMHPFIKQRFSAYMFSSDSRIAEQRQDAGAKPSKGLTVVGAVDVYVSDFGVLDVVPNRFQRIDDVFVLESDMWGIAYLDGYHIERMGKTGDSEKRVLITDWCVVSRNEEASGIVADISNSPMVA